MSKGMDPRLKESKEVLSLWFRRKGVGYKTKLAEDGI
jgi:hypothetical protein